ncbi:hypothetical protein [Helicobacter pylori]|uniref:hypothetical protein n=1 Tax=Helicobacter pylori TaxID=210 RepID=UPI001F1CA264|nr:hypothetical protein [Helicobacter pylori]
MKLEIIGKAKEKEIKNAFCSNAFFAAQVLNLSKNQERQVLELKCHFFKRPIKILPEALNINFKDTIAEKLLKDIGKDKKLKDFKETCILKWLVLLILCAYCLMKMRIKRIKRIVKRF